MNITYCEGHFNSNKLKFCWKIGRKKVIFGGKIGDLKRVHFCISFLLKKELELIVLSIFMDPFVDLCHS